MGIISMTDSTFDIAESLPNFASAAASKTEISYLCSSLFSYQQVVVPDSGPVFAKDYGWKTVTLDKFLECNAQFVIVDNRLEPAEMSRLCTIIPQSKVLFLLKVVDPYWEHRDAPWYRFVAEMIDTPRVHVMLTYHPAEFTALLLSRARRSQFVYAPYIYREEDELPIDHARRQNRLLLSGAVSKHQYPLRSQMRRVSSLWPPLRLMTQVLRHPGYPDIGQPKQHAVIGKNYIAELGKYRFAGVCSSRCRLEFLKYRELAYAGVVPVGDMPATLLDAPRDSWVPWRPNFVKLTSQLAHMTDSTERAELFRKFMRSRRNKNEMQIRVAEQLARLK